MPNIRSDTLEKVIQYCTFHTEHKADLEETKSKWDQEFVKVEQGPLFEMILAANYLDIKPMLDLTCRTVAEMIKGMTFSRFLPCLIFLGKTPDEICKLFNVPNSFTPEEEEQVLKENPWLEEK